MKLLVKCDFFLYIKLFELGLKVAFFNGCMPKLPTTKAICSNTHAGAVVLSAPIMLLCCTIASTSSK